MKPKQTQTIDPKTPDKRKIKGGGIGNRKRKGTPKTGGVQVGYHKCTKEEVVACLKKWRGKMYLAAHELDISHKTLTNYANEWPEVREAIREAKGKRLDVAEGILDKLVDEGNLGAICFLLKCQGKDRGWIERTEMRLGENATAPFNPPSHLTVDQLPLDLETKKKILEALKAKKAADAAKAIGDGEVQGQS
jgi:hypothetical protein